MAKKTFTIKTKYGLFQCTAEPEKDMGGYAVGARGIFGAVSWGKTLAEAKKMISEAIEGAVEAGIVAQAEQSGAIKITDTRARFATV